MIWVEQDDIFASRYRSDRKRYIREFNHQVIFGLCLIVGLVALGITALSMGDIWLGIIQLGLLAAHLRIAIWRSQIGQDYDYLDLLSRADENTLLAEEFLPIAQETWPPWER